MPLQQFLTSCENDLHQQSPISTVTELQPNQYMYVGPDHFEAAWIDQRDPNQGLPQPTLVQTKTLTTFSRIILNGGNVVTLDYNLLSKQKSHILLLASSWAGAACIYLARTIYQLNFNQLTTGTQIDTSIQNVSLGNNPDATILCNPSISTQLRRNFLRGRVQRQTATRLQTSHLIDYINPIYLPVVRSNDLIVFEWYNSFVLASPQFSIQNNRLIFDFKMDIADPAYVDAFTV